jgi:aminomethyltransferase
MPLYGHELGEDINALASGLDFAIHVDKDQLDRGEPYVGMDALKKNRDAGGPATKLVGLDLEGKRTARQGMKILDTPSGRSVGIITSGCLSTTLNRCIAMAYVDRALAAPGTPLAIDTARGETIPARVAPLPFYKPAK